MINFKFDAERDQSEGESEGFCRCGLPSWTSGWVCENRRDGKK